MQRLLVTEPLPHNYIIMVKIQCNLRSNLQLQVIATETSMEKSIIKKLEDSEKLKSQF